MAPKRLNQPNISAINLDETSYMPSVEVVDPVEASSEACRLPPEVGINQVGEIDKVGNSIS